MKDLEKLVTKNGKVDFPYRLVRHIYVSKVLLLYGCKIQAEADNFKGIPLTVRLLLVTVIDGEEGSYRVRSRNRRADEGRV